MAYLGAFEQLILFSVLRREDRAYGVSIREDIEERTERVVSIGAIYTTLGARDLRESYATIQTMAGGLTSELDRLAES